MSIYYSSCMFHWVRNILKRDLDLGLLPSDSSGPTRSNTRAHYVYSTDDTDPILCSACVCVCVCVTHRATMVSPEDTGSRLSRADEAAGSTHIFRDVRHSFRRAKKQIHVVVDLLLNKQGCEGATWNLTKLICF